MPKASRALGTQPARWPRVRRDKRHPTDTRPREGSWEDWDAKWLHKLCPGTGTWTPGSKVTAGKRAGGRDG